MNDYSFDAHCTLRSLKFNGAKKGRQWWITTHAGGSHEKEWFTNHLATA